MTKPTLGILHPGNMGSSVAASAQNSGCEVCWASEERSTRTRERAERIGLRDVTTLTELCDRCQVLVSVCPPHAAEDVAEQVLRNGFQGAYLDANAISPLRVRRLAERLGSAGVAFVDGGIIGGPAWKSGTTQLYLAGPGAERIATCFAAGPLEAIVLGDEVGRASALKMVYAAWTKGSAALLAGIMATAQAQGVWPDLQRQWERERPGTTQQHAQRVRGSAGRAWRWAGEMEEIAATFADAGQPEGFHQAAAEIYRRLSAYKDVAEPPALEAMLAMLLGPE